MIADVASGNGGLHRALRHIGYKRIESWDKRPRNQRCKGIELFGLFDWEKVVRQNKKYDAVIGMHPDQATDHIILYAVARKIPFLVCPCCIKPSATTYKPNSYHKWVEYLTCIAESGNMRVAQSYLSIRGCNIVLSGVPRHA